MPIRFDFQSPGANAFAGIQDFLKQRHVEERQALIDKLNEENVRNEMTNRDATTQINREAEGRMGKTTADEILQHKLGQIPYGAVDASQITDPDVAKYLESVGRFRT